MRTEQKKYIYVIQMHTGTFPAEVIKFISRYEYSHVVLALERDCKTTYSFGRKDVNNFLNSGFVEEQQNGEFFQKYDKTRCRIYEIEVTEKQHDFMKKLLQSRKDSQHQYKYDYLGLFLRTFHIPVYFENKAVCSQFVAEILEEGQIIHLKKPSYLMRPQDFDDCRGLRAVYEGLYSEYRLA